MALQASYGLGNTDGNRGVSSDVPGKQCRATTALGGQSATVLDAAQRYRISVRRRHDRCTKQIARNSAPDSSSSVTEHFDCCSARYTAAAIDVADTQAPHGVRKPMRVPGSGREGLIGGCDFARD